MDSISERLRYARMRAPMTQSELSKRSNVALITINRIENGGPGSTNPRPETVRRLADALDVEASWLLFGEESELGKEAA
jgi:transcriptional regulator with XRE-family HTH domain